MPGDLAKKYNAWKRMGMMREELITLNLMQISPLADTGITALLHVGRQEFNQARASYSSS
jgi:hypothetical protein